MEVLDHKCPGCGAMLPFNPKTQKWNCDYCGGSYTLEEINEYELKHKEEVKSKSKKSNVDADMYECPNCGAKIIADENTTATFCVYCGSTSIIKNKLVDEFKPNRIVPFKNTKEEAIEAFKKFKKGKIFAPKDFSNKENIEKITGVYIPFWTYDCHGQGSIDCKAVNVKSWRSGDYRYTQTDTYDLLRAGDMDFEKVPVDGSTKFDDDTMDSIEPFDYNELVDFDMSYLSGFLSEKYDVGKEEAYQRANSRIENSVIDLLKDTATGYGTVTIKNKNIEIQENKSEYILLPVWMLNIKYKEKMYLFAMNGQTGKMVGNIPIDNKKRLLYSVGFFMLALIVSYLVCILFMMI